MSQSQKVDPRVWAQIVEELLTTVRGSRKGLAEKTGVSTRTILRWLNQETTPSYLAIKAVANGCNIPLGLILKRLGLLRGQPL